MPNTPTEDDPRPLYFPVSLAKLLVMSLCTAGLYQVYWFYANWRLVKYREQRRLSAPWRSVLGLLFALPLFNRMARPEGRRGAALALGAFVAWTCLSLAAYGPGPWATLSLASVLPLLPMQSLANRANRRVAPGHARNARIRGWNVVALALGGPVLLMVGYAVLVYVAQVWQVR